MVNWVTRRDIGDAAKGGAGLFVIILLVLMAIVVGAWWWVSGATRTGAPLLWWHRAVSVAWRAGLFVAAFALAYVHGPIGLVATVGMLAMVAAGFLLYGPADHTHEGGHLGRTPQ